MEEKLLDMGEGRIKEVDEKGDYVRTNFTITLSRMFFLPAFLCAYLGLGSDRIAFAVDYPYERIEEAIHFIKEAPIPKY